MEKLLRLVLLASFIFSFAAFADDTDHHPQEQRDMVVTGDSWAMFMCLDQVFERSILKFGLTHTNVLGCPGATRFGGRAVEWETYHAAKHLRNLLAASPHVRVIYLSIGGNDFIAHWNKNMTPDQEATFFAGVRDATKSIAQELLSIRPEARVLVTGYDYGNFKDYSKIISAYGDVLKSTGYPTTEEINTGLIRFSKVMAGVADGKKIFYIHHCGISHYYFGNSEYNLPPFTTKHPDEISPPSDPAAWGGVPKYEVSGFSLLHLLFLQDAYHPNCPEFMHIAAHALRNYIAGWLKESDPIEVNRN
jgi:hypothetical protein